MPDQPYPSGLPAIFEVVRRLRAPDGCPWDREQTHESLRPYLLEETYEALEAIDKSDDEKLQEELGDVLLQVAMHAEIARGDGRWDAASVSERVAAKMVERHPHVFGATQVADAAEVLRNWEHQKAAEARAAGRGEESVLDRVVQSMPALAWALALQKRAARVGFDYRNALDTVGGVGEEARELAEARDPDELFREFGDLLFSLVALARKQRVNPEDALRAAGERFADRFKKVERELRDRGVGFRDVEAAEIDRLWEDSKPG